MLRKVTNCCQLHDKNLKIVPSFFVNIESNVMTTWTREYTLRTSSMSFWKTFTKCLFTFLSRAIWVVQMGGGGIPPENVNQAKFTDVWRIVLRLHYCRLSYVKLHLYDKPTNKLTIRILSQTSILYLIRHVSVILMVGLHLLRPWCQQRNIVGRKIVAHSGFEPATFGLQA